jgi:flagellar motor protein MotB
LAGSREVTDLAGFITKYQISESLLVIDQDIIKRLLIPSFKSDKNTEMTIKNLDELISIKDDVRGIIISFHRDILFDSGKTTIKKEAFQPLDSIAEAMESCPNEILIMGHTDNIPIQSRLYKSNQEFSLYRGPEKRALNRRVEIIFKYL